MRMEQKTQALLVFCMINLHDILVNKQYVRIPQFFEEFPNKHTEILIDIRNDLPDYIDFWAIKYGFEDELEIRIFK